MSLVSSRFSPFTRFGSVTFLAKKSLSFDNRQPLDNAGTRQYSVSIDDPNSETRKAYYKRAMYARLREKERLISEVAEESAEDGADFKAV
jgi:hypothetical protein